MVLCEYLDRNDGSSIFLPGYLERTSVLNFVSFLVTWTYRMSALFYLHAKFR